MEKNKAEQEYKKLLLENKSKGNQQKKDKTQKAVELYKSGMTLREIGGLLNISHESVRKLLKEGCA